MEQKHHADKPRTWTKIEAKKEIRQLLENISGCLEDMDLAQERMENYEDERQELEGILRKL